MPIPNAPAPEEQARTASADPSIGNDFDSVFSQLEGHTEQTAPVEPAGSQEHQPSEPDAAAASDPAGLAYGTVQRWSVLLDTVPPIHRIKLLRELPAAIANGEIRAVSLREKLTHKYQDVGGKPHTLTISDEAILYTADVHRWMTDHVNEHVYDLLAEQKHLEVDFEQLTSGELDFERLVKLRRDKEGPAAKGTAKPTGSGAGKPGSKATAPASKTKSAPKREQQKPEAPAS
jgi:hypothetical protein